MFKRVEKRRRKREEEEELGLDEDMKEVLGIHDTDSEESDSDSDQSSSSDNVFGGSDQDEPDEDHLEEHLDDDDVVDESENESEQPAITVQEALRDPVYLVSLQPEVKACIVCPGKLLKGGKMVGIHNISNAHIRRFKQFKVLVEKVSLTSNAWDVVRQNLENKPKLLPLAVASNSKRAEKRKAKSAARKEQRQKQRAKAKARKAATAQLSTTSPSNPPMKRQKVEEPNPTTSATPAVQPTEMTKPSSTETSIKSIVRSTSNRAKQARARASLKGPKNT